MRTVVKDDERAHQEAGGWKDQRQRQQIRHVKCEIHQDANGHIRRDRGEDLEYASPEARVRVSGEFFIPEPASRWGQRDAPMEGVDVPRAQPPRAAIQAAMSASFYQSKRSGRAPVAPPACLEGLSLPEICLGSHHQGWSRPIRASQRPVAPPQPAAYESWPGSARAGLSTSSNAPKPGTGPSIRNISIVRSGSICAWLRKASTLRPVSCSIIAVYRSFIIR